MVSVITPQKTRRGKQDACRSSHIRRMVYAIRLFYRIMTYNAELCSKDKT